MAIPRKSAAKAEVVSAEPLKESETATPEDVKETEVVGSQQSADIYEAAASLPRLVEPNPSDSPEKFSKDIQNNAEVSAGIRSVTIDVPQPAGKKHTTATYTYADYLRSLNGGLVTAQLDTTEHGGSRGTVEGVSYTHQYEQKLRDELAAKAAEQNK